MKKLLALVLVPLLTSSLGWGQSLPRLENRPRQMQGWFVTRSNGPLLLLGAQETDYSSLVVDPQEIRIVKAFKDSAILAPMGPKARNGVLLIELTQKKTLLKLEDVLDYFQVPMPHRELRVLLNKQPVNRTRFLADVKRIEKVEVIQQDKASPFRLGWDENEQFLNIVTVKEGKP